jgi:hypothetical protein
VFRAVTAGKAATDITPALLNQEALEVLGHELDLDAEEVHAALDPTLSVRGKVTLGGPAPSEVQRQIADGLTRLAAEQSRLGERQERLSEADATLDRLAEQLATEVA